MRRGHSPTGEALAAVLLAGTVPALVWAAPPAALDGPPAAFVKQYCTDCHNGDLAEARINLQQMIAAADFGRGFKDWEKAIRMLRGGKMPPQDAPQPATSERAAAAQALADALDAYIEQNAGDPGPVVLRRLTSSEFGYSIRDLTGLDLKLERQLEGDAAGGEGFTNVGSAQFMQDSSLERYLEAAKRVADHAVIGSGPLSFFADPGQTGRELSAIARIQEIYRQHGFRTAAGEGAVPFGLDLYPRAMFVAWRYRHRAALGLPQATLSQLAREEGLSERFCEHVYQVLSSPAATFPLADIAGQWQALPAPGDRPEAEIRAACQRVTRELREWQSTLAAAAGDEEEAAVLTEGEVQVRTAHSFQTNITWEEGAQTAEFELSVTSASGRPAAGALVVWRNARLRFRSIDSRRNRPVPLARHLSPQSREQLKIGRHPAGGEIGPDDFVLAGETKPRLTLVVPEGMAAAQLAVDVELDVEHGADSVVRCRIADTGMAGKTAAAVGAASALLGNPASPAAREWRVGVAEFARLLPEVSQREPAPSDRDPIPPPFDNTYNLPERNHFHYAIKYHRDDRFLVEHILGDAAREQLDHAWTDLLTAFEYHDANLRFVAKKFAVDLGGRGIADLDAEAIARLPAEPRGYIERLHDEYHSAQRALAAAEPGHVADGLKLAERAWRRPLAPDEQRRLRDYYSRLRNDEQLDHVRAVRALLARILVAPAFLYRAEATPGSGGEVAPLSDWELAGRLSYFLWSSVPDDELRRAAAAGKLSEPDELARQTRRMLQDPKAGRLAAEFFGQWLGFYRFDEFRGIDSQRFPEFDDALKASMLAEANSFCEHIVREDRPPAEILFADYTFVNQALARHYGLDAGEIPTGRHVRVDQLTDQHRGGVLGMAAVLASTSAPLRTSAVKRGDWVLRRVIGTPVSPPPADAGSIAADDAGADGLTVRRRLEAHRTAASCVNCHAQIDPLGFALEHYDPLGRWREAYRDGQPIDSAGTLSDGTEITGLDGLKQYLRREQPQFERNLCGKLLGYALGRTELASDRPLIEAMQADLKSGGRFGALVERIVASRQFRNRRNLPLPVGEGRGEGASPDDSKPQP